MNLLLPERPLVILPQLAIRIGLNEAIILQQMWYWQSRSQHTYDEKIWFYKSFDAWHEEIPFLSQKTIKRCVSKLNDLKLISIDKLGAQFGRHFDKTNWYTINTDSPILSDRSGQSVPIVSGQTVPMTYITETTTKNISSSKRDKSLLQKKKLKKEAIDIVQYLNTKSGYNYQEVDSHLDMIIALMKEGIDKKTFFDVIDAKCKQWGNDQNMSAYLRPATLFTKRNFANYSGQLKKTHKAAAPYHKDFKETESNPITFINCTKCKQYRQAFTSYLCEECCHAPNIENNGSNNAVEACKSVSDG